MLRTLTKPSGVRAAAMAALLTGALFATTSVSEAATNTSQAQAIVSAAEMWLTHPVTAYCWKGGNDTGPTHGAGDSEGYSGPSSESGCTDSDESIAGFDCSGLVKFAVYQALGISLAHKVSDEAAGTTDNGDGVARHTTITSISALEPGDIVIFGTPGDFVHDGVYIGHGEMVNAYDFENDGDNGPSNEYWGVTVTPISWETAANPFYEGVRYWTTSTGNAAGASKAKSSTANTAGASKAKSPTAVVTGNVDCSNVVSLDGFSGSPETLQLSAAGKKSTLEYPDKLQSGDTLFPDPGLGIYRLDVPIPKGSRSEKVTWSLTCRDSSGDDSGNYHGSFAVARSATRDICNHGGISNPCNPPLDNALGECGFGLISGLQDGVVAKVGSVTLDPPKSVLSKAEAAISAVTAPVVGVLIACGGVASQLGGASTGSGLSPSSGRTSAGVLPASAWTPTGGATVTAPDASGTFSATFGGTYWGGLYAGVSVGCNYKIQGMALLEPGGSGYGFGVRAMVDSSGVPHSEGIQYDPGIGGYRDTLLPQDSETGNVIPTTLDNGWHEISVEVLGDQYRSSVDGTLIFSGTTPLICGGVFIRIWRSTVELRDLSVTPISKF
jgi:cell wall-associated NlpC family hydrolase